MPEIVNNGDSEAMVKLKILDILEFDGISTEDILSWGVATVRLNIAATRLGFPHIEDRENGLSARQKINALALSPAPVFPENIDLPEISGMPRYLEQLETTDGSWNAYPAATYSYQWKADGVNISLATNQEFTLTVSEIGKEITVEVTATNFSGSGLAESLPLGPVISEPINTNPPVINGEASYEEELNVTNGIWAAYPLPISYSYRWFSDNVEISDETDNQYETTIDDIGKSITAEVTASNSEGNNAETTAAFGPITSIPINRVVPVITGYARSGQTLNSNNGTWAAYPAEIDYSYQWFADDELIIDEDNNSFVLTDAVAGKEINIEVDAENELGSNQASSIKTTRVEPSWSPEKASLFIDFEQNRIFDKRLGVGSSTEFLNFSRLSKAWDFDANGSLYEAENNVARRVDGRGVLLEPSRTNYVPNSLWDGAAVGVVGSGGSFGAGWGATTSNSTWTINSIDTDSDGLRWIDFTCVCTNSTGSNVFPRLQMPPTPVTPNAAYNASLWIEVLEYAVVQSGIGISCHEFSSPSVPIGETSSTPQIQSAPSAKQRASVSRLFGATGTYGRIQVQCPAFVLPGTTQTVRMRIAQGQLEQGTFATSPIPTSGSQVARAGDLLTATVPDGGRAFALECDLLEPLVNNANVRFLLTYSNGTLAERYAIRINAAGILDPVSVTGSVVSPLVTSRPSIALGKNYVYAVLSPEYRRCGRIGAGDSDAGTDDFAPAAINRLGIGGVDTSTNGNTAINAGRFAEAPVSAFSSPADAYAWAESIAEGWAS